MCGHIVGALVVVFVGAVFGGEASEVGFDVGANGRVGVLLDQEGG